MQLRLLQIGIMPLAAVLALAACSDDSGNGGPDGGKQDTGVTDGPPTDKELQFPRKEVLDTNRAGKHAVIAASGNQIGIAYFSELTEKVDVICPPLNNPDKHFAQDLMYVGYDGASWGTPVKVSQTIGVTFGLDMVFAGGQPNIGFLGGELGNRTCHSSDAVRATSSDGGQSWSENTILAAGPTGDTVGHWISLAADPSGAVHSTFRDVHFSYYEHDGNYRADLRYDGAAGVSEGIGDGVYASLHFKPDGSPVIFAYNDVAQGIERGIKSYVQSGGQWTIKQVVGGGTLEKPGFAHDGNGLFGVAYYAPNDTSLYYLESGDLLSWSPKKLVDYSTTVHGTFASLAFDSQGNPGVSYYRCSNAGADKCEPENDALMFSWRLGGKWKTWEVDTGKSNYCGRYTSLAFTSADLPVIAYQCVTLDNQTNDFIDTLKVAHGVWK